MQGPGARKPLWMGSRPDSISADGTDTIAAPAVIVGGDRHARSTRSRARGCSHRWPRGLYESGQDSWDHRVRRGTSARSGVVAGGGLIWRERGLGRSPIAAGFATGGCRKAAAATTVVITRRTNDRSMDRGGTCASLSLSASASYWRAPHTCGPGRPGPHPGADRRRRGGLGRRPLRPLAEWPSGRAENLVWRGAWDSDRDARVFALALLTQTPARWERTPRQIAPGDVALTAAAGVVRLARSEQEVYYVLAPDDATAAQALTALRKR